MSARPQTPPLSRGDLLIVTSGNHKLRLSTNEYRVTRVGPKWLYAVPLVHFGIGPERERQYEVPFWREDMRKGRPGSRSGVGAARARTPEQAAYDDETDAARHFIRDVAGLDIRSGSPYKDRDLMVALAELLAETLPDTPREAGDDA